MGGLVDEVDSNADIPLLENYRGNFSSQLQLVEVFLFAKELGYQGINKCALLIMGYLTDGSLRLLSKEVLAEALSSHLVKL